MQRLEATPSSAGCRVDGIAPTADIARLQQRVLALVAEANCAAVASPGAVDGNARAGYGFTLTLAPLAGGGVCLQPPETPPAEPQAGVDMQSRHEHPPVHPDTARAAGQHGVAMVVVLVDADEVPVASLIARSTDVPALDAAALEASQRWTYGRHDMPRAPGIGLVRVPVPFDAD